MSLILDALRKSEAERRRGQAPDLFSGAATLPTRPRAPWRRSAMGIAIAVASLLVALWAWSEGAWDTTDGVQEHPQRVAGTPAPLAIPVPAVVQSPTANRPAQAETVAPAPPPATLPADPAAPLPAAPPAAVPPLSSSATLPNPVPALTPPVETSVDVPSQDAVAPIAVLSAAERSSLPPMKLSMHVWNSDPGRRFAIVDGQRIAEGALLGSAVVEEIRRDGVVLNINGRRLLLSRP